MTTDWSEWSSASSDGIRMRTRQYAKAGMLDVSMCKETLVEKRAQSEDSSSSSAAASEFCMTKPLGEWTSCSATGCGEEGVMTREMMFVNKEKALMMSCDMSVLKLMKKCVGECAGGERY